MAIDLKPCPFCGKKPWFNHDHTMVICGTDYCPLMGGFVSINAWNTRHESAKAEQPKRCKHGVWPYDHCYDCEKETHQPDDCTISFELFRRVKGQWMLDNQNLALDEDFTERAEKFAFEMLWKSKAPKRESGEAEAILELFHKAQVAFDHDDDVTQMLCFGEATERMEAYLDNRGGV